MSDQLDYRRRLDEAGLWIVRSVMEEAAQTGLPGEHHFYLTFDTEAPGVELDERLRASHGEEMTIVLQHQYDDLQVDEKGFAVTLSFSSVAHRIEVPFSALRRFVDPAANFGLEFPVRARSDEPQDLGPRPVTSESQQSGPNFQDGEAKPASESEQRDPGSGPRRLQETDETQPVQQPKSGSPSSDPAGTDGKDGEPPSEDSGVVRLDDFRRR